ncbi:MAG: peptidoglycan DD-metalloendopeptidase family protein [Bacteroides sp.]|nr:MAG: peptidoglycan DD-metalloendopeptidase family protein [Bacteroides sp.]
MKYLLIILICYFSLTTNYIVNCSENNISWPVNDGFVINAFGQNKHYLLNNVLFDNPGIDIATYKELEVMSIFDGYVYDIIYIKNNDIIIIIKHGAYTSIYANIEKLYLKKGEFVKNKQKIGIIKKYSHKIRVIKLIIMKEYEIINPMQWFVF